MARPKNKDEYRAELAQSFAHILEEKGLDWKQGWSGGGRGAPMNGVTKACYRGCNAFWLSLTAMSKGYDDPRWVTMVQIMDKKGTYHPKSKWHLKAGSKATYVEYWYPFDLIKRCALTWEQYGEELKNGRAETDFRLASQYTAVFNACEVEGMPELKREPPREITPDELVKKLSENMGVEIIHDGGGSAYYLPLQDKIHLPEPGKFFSDYDYNSTALHELAHSTGHVSRLARSMSGGFGSPEYAYEELVAEMASCFMGASIEGEVPPSHLDNHKAYVQSWVRLVREKPETLMKAIKEAQTVASYMDWKAGLITELEYLKTAGSAKTVRVKEPELER